MNIYYKSNALSMVYMESKIDIFDHIKHIKLQTNQNSVPLLTVLVVVGNLVTLSQIYKNCPHF